MNLETIFENLETLEPAALIRLADSTDILITQEQYDLVMLIQELASRLAHVLNVDIEDDEDESEARIHEFN